MDIVLKDVSLRDDYGRKVKIEEQIAELLDQQIEAEVEAEVSSAFAKIAAPVVERAIANAVEKTLASFMQEEVVLTSNWEKKTFVGTIEDMLKLRFDDALLHPVDSNGKRLVGCTSGAADTYIQWRLNQRLEKEISSRINNAEDAISSKIKSAVAAQMDELKSGLLEKEVARQAQKALQELARAGGLA